MDPATIYAILAAAIVFVICYAVFSVATRESGFDASYSKSKLVIEDDKNVKGKAKNAGKVKKPAKVERKPTVEKQDVPIKVVEPTTTESSSVSSPEQTTPVKTDAEKSDASSDQVNNASSTAAAKKNKKKPKKTNSVDSNSETISAANDICNATTGLDKIVEKTVVQENAQPKVRGKRDVSNPTNINMEKLIERLGASEDFSPEYLSFICQFAEQTKQREARLNESVSKLQREVSSKNQEIDKLHDQLYAAQLTLGKVQSLEQALKDENAKYNLLVASVSPKLADNQQLRDTNHKLEGQLNNQKIAFANSMDKLKRESEQFVSQLRNSLTQANNQIQQKEIQIKGLEDELKQKNNVFAEKEQGLIEELQEKLAQKDRFIGQIQEASAQKDKAADRLIEELKQKEQSLISEKNKEIDFAHVKLEAELKESLQRIDELRSKNYKLVESINTLYKYNNQVNENKKPVD